MSDDQEWGPWVDHDGKGCPVPIGTVIEVIEVDWRTWREYPPDIGIAEGGNGWRWRYGRPTKSLRDPSKWARPITRYRIRKPKALRDLITIAADPYAPPLVISPEGPLRQPAPVPA